MVLLVALTLAVMALGLRLFNPLLEALTPLLSLAWVGWALLLLGLWLLAGPTHRP
ncbi:MAG: hypothetical protein ACKOOC_01880 [Cyanobium sp.]